MKCPYCNLNIHNKYYITYNKYNYCFNCNLLIYKNSYYNENIHFLFSSEKIKSNENLENDHFFRLVVDKNNFVPKYCCQIDVYSGKRSLWYSLALLEEELITDNQDILKDITPQNINQKLKTILTFM